MKKILVLCGVFLCAIGFYFAIVDNSCWAYFTISGLLCTILSNFKPFNK